MLPLAEGAYFRELHDLLPGPYMPTQGFLVFTAAVLAVYWSLPRHWTTVRVWVLLLASFHLYAAWNAVLALLILGTTLADFLLARHLERTTNPRRRTLLLVGSIGMNLGLLAYFKYRGFFLDELHALLGISPDGGVMNLIVPFGISFYTFEAISYAADVYRRRIAAETSLPRFLLFILFFPHLVAGPIVRAGDFLPQTRRVKRWNWLRVQLAVQLLVLGAVKKFAIADRMAIFANPVFLEPDGYSTPAVWLAVLAYSLRIYADFSGYSDMALGVAHLFGYTLRRNFAMPYLAANVAEFWHRWHISLSTWLRDYLFIPLGGSRCGPWRTARNLILTMSLGGLWHGANGSFIAWGLLHALFLIVHRGFRAFTEGRPWLTERLHTRLGKGLRIALTFTCVSLGWVLFRPEWSQAMAMYRRLFFGPRTGASLLLHPWGLWATVLLLLAGYVLSRRPVRIPPVGLGAVYAIGLMAALMVAPDVGKTFLYFSF